jgi:hypothetical protein
MNPTAGAEIRTASSRFDTGAALGRRRPSSRDGCAVIVSSGVPISTGSVGKSFVAS